MQKKTAKKTPQANKNAKVQKVDLGRGDGERLFIQQRNRKSRLFAWLVEYLPAD
jgi:hypothetical protein